MSDNISNSTSNLSTSETDCCCSIECCKSCIKRFVLIPNKISNVDSLKICCEDNCLKKDLLYASCASTNGYVNVRYDGKIRYYLAKEKGKNNLIMTYSQNSFNKKDCYSKRYSLFYFEVKMVKETDKQCNAILGFDTKTVGIFLCNDNSKWDDYQKFNWKDGDVFGCGAIFQPNERSHTIVFFTKNGQKIGNQIFLEEIDELYPSIGLMSCSVETNFGYDLATKPFIYDVDKHFC